jgi:hypothetical protein
VLYTKIGSNIDNLSPEQLANYAINSAKQKAGENGLDGISYLISTKSNGIITPLSQAYENQILKTLDAPSLKDALQQIRKNV